MLKQLLIRVLGLFTLVPWLRRQLSHLMLLIESDIGVKCMQVRLRALLYPFALLRHLRVK